jgi:hypothetical protein
MRLTVLALLLSAGSLASGQQNPSVSQNASPVASAPVLTFIAPPSVAAPDSTPATVSILLTIHPNLNWTDRGLPQIEPAIPAQLFTRRQNPVQFLALNHLVPPVAPTRSPHGKPEPIPTTWPDAHFEKIPTSWPGLNYLLIDQTAFATATTEPKKK